MADSIYKEIGALNGASYIVVDADGKTVGGGSHCEPIWGCIVCGVVVFDKERHDAHHDLNDSPISAMFTEMKTIEDLPTGDNRTKAIKIPPDDLRR